VTKKVGVLLSPHFNTFYGLTEQKKKKIYYFTCLIYFSHSCVTFQLSVYQWGSRVGAWRILYHLSDRYGIK